jgi:hypothetical protein
MDQGVIFARLRILCFCLAGRLDLILEEEQDAAAFGSLWPFISFFLLCLYFM